MKDWKHLHTRHRAQMAPAGDTLQPAGVFWLSCAGLLVLLVPLFVDSLPWNRPAPVAKTEPPPVSLDLTDCPAPHPERARTLYAYQFTLDENGALIEAACVRLTGRGSRLGVPITRGPSAVY